MQVITDGLLTHYVRSGKGRIILILPGWADTSVSWLPVQKALSASYDVVVLDLPGFGNSQAPQSEWGLNEYADFISHFLDKIYVKDLFAVIGHSNGGAIAIRGLSGGKMAASRLILVASAGIRSATPGRRNALKLIAKTGKLLTTPLPKRLKQKLRLRLYSSVGSDMLVAEHMQETFKKVVTDDVQSDAARITIPTLLIYGDADMSTPLRFGQIFNQAIKGSRLELFAGAGHFIHIENKNHLVKSMQDFLT